MKENIFWDRNKNIIQVKEILKDESNAKFIDYASLLLSRTDNIKEVFTEYLDKFIFCKNWRKIKQKMRKNKWNDSKINYWDEVFRVIINVTDLTKKQFFFKRYEFKNPELKKLGERIRKARKKMGWTQKGLAKNVGLSQQTISIIEKGNFNFSFGSLMKIISALNLSFVLEDKDEYPRSVDTSSPYVFSLKDVNTSND